MAVGIMAVAVENMSKSLSFIGLFTDFSGYFYILNDERAKPYINTLCIEPCSESSRHYAEKTI
jgi:hypothetical protein